MSAVPGPAPRTALVTGGSRGIGAATAVRLASQGWSVAITYRERSDAADSAVGQCRSHGVPAVAIAADLAADGAVDALFAELDGHVATLGPLGAVVNNAGIVSPAGPVASYDADRLRSVFELNVIGAFLVAGAAVRRMSTEHGGTGGVIVNVSSRAAVLAGAREYVDYGATKAALDVLTVGLAQETAAEGIRVVGVRPGLIDTEIHAPGRLERLGTTPPMGRPGTAAEVANVIAFLVSDEASYVTGATIDVGGGR